MQGCWLLGLDPPSDVPAHHKIFKIRDFRFTMKKKLTRSKKDKLLAGVCAGIAKYFNTDPTLIRLIWVLFTLLTGILTGIIAYIIAAIIIPEEK